MGASFNLFGTMDQNWSPCVVQLIIQSSIYKSVFERNEVNQRLKNIQKITETRYVQFIAVQKMLYEINYFQSQVIASAISN